MTTVSPVTLGNREISRDLGRGNTSGEDSFQDSGLQYNKSVPKHESESL